MWIRFELCEMRDFWIASILTKAESHNDERIERLYFLQKQNEAKTLIRLFDLILSLDSCFARIYNRSNGGVALRCFGAK